MAQSKVNSDETPRPPYNAYKNSERHKYRMSVAVLFAAPAAFAGYHATHGVAALTMPSGIWQMIFAVTGSIAVSATAWTRMAMLTPAPSVRGNAGRQVQP